MLNARELRKIFHKIQVVRPPRHRLSTFGTTQISYKLITDVPGLSDRARVRLGVVTAEKPAIITPDALREQFVGFGEYAQNHAASLISQYGEAVRGLEYQFRNEPASSRIELTPPDTLTQTLTKEFDREDNFRTALIRGTDKLWELSVMKFIVEETLSSFSANVRELQERGFFDPAGRDEERRHREIQGLLRRAKVDRASVPLLGKKLKEYGLFDHYQDAFFHLLNK